jgi:hypothetical protein
MSSSPYHRLCRSLASSAQAGLKPKVVDGSHVLDKAMTGAWHALRVRTRNQSQTAMGKLFKAPDMLPSQA